jgi:alpha-mannosidase
LPQLLCRTGFQAALHFTLDDGQFPKAPNARVRWDSPDGSVVEAIAEVPLDATRSLPFLHLPRRLGEAMDREQVATILFAHWPSVTGDWFDDLRRIGRRTPALGKFVNLDEYFASTATATHVADFSSDDYRTPYLRQSVETNCKNVISTIASIHAEHLLATTRRSFELLKAPIYQELPGLKEDLVVATQSAGCDEAAIGTAIGHVEINCNSFPIRRTVSYARLMRDQASGKIWFRHDSATVDDVQPMTELPGMGFVWMGAERHHVSARRSQGPIRAGLVLRNEFCEVTISTTTGGIQSIHDFRTRGNRLSQQIALRRSKRRGLPGTDWRSPDRDITYSVMVADFVDSGRSNQACDCVETAGRLVDLEGTQLARFRQRTALRLGSPVLELSVELDIDELPAGDPCNNYYCLRFALPDTELTWFRNIGLEIHETSAQWLEAPLFVEARAGRWRTAILTGGLPHHRRVPDRTLDTLLVVAGEDARKFTLGVAIDSTQPSAAAIEFMTRPEIRYSLDASPPIVEKAWLYHLDAKNVIATTWEELENGFRVRLRETAGSAGPVHLRSFRPLKSARQTDFLGNTLCELVVEEDRIWMEMSSYGWIQVEAHFAA